MKPLLLAKETKRDHKQDSIKKPYTYDYNRDMNMCNGKIFIEEASFSERELLTKTEETPERDDEDTYIDIATSGYNNRKNSDIKSGAVLEMISKTFADRESDDEDDSYNYQ